MMDTQNSTMSAGGDPGSNQGFDTGSNLSLPKGPLLPDNPEDTKCYWSVKLFVSSTKML